MKLLGGILLTVRQVRHLGILLITLGMVLPFGFLLLYAATWTPPPPDPDELFADPRPAMVILEGGRFLMGSPKDETGRYEDETQHEVEVSRFMISLTEVTQEQYEEVMGTNPVASLTDDFDALCSEAGLGGDLPVVCVNWEEALEYCNKLSVQEGLTPAYENIGNGRASWNRQANGYRLPTEAEWEFAARAGSQTRWVGTNEESRVCDYGNFADVSAKELYPEWETLTCDDGFPRLAPAQGQLPNRWLLYGFGGNALEWVWDTYDESFPSRIEDPVADDPRGSLRVLRGGSWRYVPRNTRVANRSRNDPSWRGRVVGFRVARSFPSAL